MRTEESRALLEDERTHLLAARDGLRLHAGPTGGTQRDDTGELSGLDEHVADVASDTLEREVDLSLLHAVESDLAAIEAAVARLCEGTYGRCEHCGAAIGDERLRAVPAATRCLRHQDRAERADARLRRAALAGPGREAAAHLDLLPAEDAVPSAPAAEEAAVHEIP